MGALLKTLQTEPRARFEVGRLLAEGGDGRIAIDPATGLNRYGCAPFPAEGPAAFGSSTASVISASAYAAVQGLAERLQAHPAPARAYAAETGRVRERLARLCGLPAEAARGVILAPSGTDVHLLAADLVRGSSLAPLTAVTPDPSETGRGVPSALCSLAFDDCTPLGGACVAGRPLDGAVEGRTIGVALRDADGTPRPIGEVDADVEAACSRAARTGGKVLLVLVDVSKTGLIAPSPALAATLKTRFGEGLEVLVDACQFRLTGESLQAYLAAGFLVAVTGSKFLGGPAFSGALLCPEALAERLRGQPLIHALGAYSARHDWPCGWAAGDGLPDVPNFGLLFRWEAALHELSRLRALDPAEAASFLARFGAAVGGLLKLHDAFAPVPGRPLERPGPGGWDSTQTVFPFLLRPGGVTLTAEATAAVFNALRRPDAGAAAVSLGQPVNVGARDGRTLAALRLSASAPLIVEALTTPDGAAQVIQRALDALALTAACAGAVARN